MRQYMSVASAVAAGEDDATVEEGKEGSTAALYRMESGLRDALRPRYSGFLEAMNAQPGGLKLLAVLRAGVPTSWPCWDEIVCSQHCHCYALLLLLRETWGLKALLLLIPVLQRREENAPALHALGSYLKEKLVTWLSPAALTLHLITWDDPASLLEKIVAYERIHPSSEEEKTIYDAMSTCRALGLIPHCNHNLITLLLLGTVPGLEVACHGDWIWVQPVPGAFVVNFGHQLEIATNGLLKSVEHRAVPNAMAVRTSVVMSILSIEDCLVASATELVGGDGNPAWYRAVTFHEFIRVYKTFGVRRESVKKAFRVWGVAADRSWNRATSRETRGEAVAQELRSTVT